MLHAHNSDSSAEAREIMEMARTDPFIWTLAAMVACLNARLTAERVTLVMSTALSIRYDHRCILPLKQSVEIGRSPDSPDIRYVSDIPTSVRNFYVHGCPSTMLRRPRFGPDCTLGRRLAEDNGLLSDLAPTSGLQEELLDTLVRVQV